MRSLMAGGCVATLLVLGQPARAEPGWYDCTAWGTSHTGRYTFRIGTDPCSVYWKELDRSLEIRRCAPPVIVAVKPFAVSNGYELAFDLATGRFEDFTPAWSDRGRCARISDGATPP